MKRGDLYINQEVSSRSMESGLTPDIAALAHELKTPLALIRQLALFAGQDGLTEDERVQAIERISVTGDRTIRLVSDLTKAFALRGSELVETEPVNVVSLCEEVAHELWPLYQAYGKDLRVPPVRRAVVAVGHRELLKRVLVNYADNALKYSNDSSVVKFSVLKRDGQVQVGVRDRGPVLSRGDIKRARQEAPLTGRPLSSGLGLGVVEHFARCMQGEVGSVRHRDGMTFFVSIPSSEQLSLL